MFAFDGLSRSAMRRRNAIPVHRIAERMISPVLADTGLRCCCRISVNGVQSVLAAPQTLRKLLSPTRFVDPCVDVSLGLQCLGRLTNRRLRPLLNLFQFGLAFAEFLQSSRETVFEFAFGHCTCGRLLETPRLLTVRSRSISS